MRPAHAVLLGVAVVVALGGARSASHLPEAAPAIDPDVVLARYVSALRSLARPKAMTFVYVVEQLGPRNLEQTHRVYRSGRNERDETLVVDGQAFPHPSVRMIANRTYRYDLATIAPKPDAYAFTFRMATRSAGGFVYAFKTQRRAAGAFAVNEVQIDGRTFLPAILRFKIAGGGARGSGQLSYGRAQSYWVISEARVNARLSSGAVAHERITWTNYRFPSSLPPSTFHPPRPLPDLAPTATP